MKWVILSTGLLLLLLTGPIAVAVGDDANVSGDWRLATRESSGLAPAPETTREAVVQIYGARAFRWRGVEYRVARAAGPERIAPEWWRPPEAPHGASGPGHATRDYFHLEDEAGRRFWLYRAGLAERGEAPAWFLHGLHA